MRCRLAICLLAAGAVAQEPGTDPERKPGADPQPKAAPAPEPQAGAEPEPQAGAEPEPGPIPASLVRVGRLEIPAAKGGPDEALAVFVAAHDHDRAGRTEDALAGYLRFLGMPGRHELPPRYVVTVRERVDRRRAAVRQRYDAAVQLYGKDRARGIAALRDLAGRFAALPEGAAARALWHTDRLRLEIDAARARERKGQAKEAAQALAQAVRRYDAALYRYEAKTLLLKLGGPDLFEPGERVGGDDPAEKRPKKEEGEEPTIEIGDDG